MENTLSFADVLKDIHAENLREKLRALETECGARKLSLSNPLTDVVYRKCSRTKINNSAKLLNY